MLRYLRLYGFFFRQRQKVNLEYPLDFLIGAGATALSQAGSMAAIWFLTEHVSHIRGWTFFELAFLMGLVLTAKSLHYMFADSLWALGYGYVRTGQFDRFMLRPINPLFHFLAEGFSAEGFGTFVFGTFLLVASLARLPVVVGPLELSVLLVALVSGGIMFFSVNLFAASLSFFIVDALPAMKAFYEAYELATYPLEIYRRPIQFILTFVIPFALPTYFPAAWLLGKAGNAYVWWGLPASLLVLLLAYQTWRVGLKRYASTGS